MGRTKTDELLRARQEAVEGTDPVRARVLQLTRVFKASWLDLGEALTKLRGSREWERWGHPSFEDYCRRELALTPATADKLTGSYAFLAKRAPDVTRRVRRPAAGFEGDDQAAMGGSEEDGTSDARVPSYQAVDFWRRADEAGLADEGTMEELGEAVLSGASPARLSRQFPSAFSSGGGANGERAGRARQAALAAARKLADALVDCPEVPRPLVKELENALGRLVETLRKPDKEQAA